MEFLLENVTGREFREVLRHTDSRFIQTQQLNDLMGGLGA